MFKKSKLKPNSIFSKIFLILISLSFISGGLILVLVMREQSKFFERELVSKHQLMARVISEDIKAGHLTREWPFETLKAVSESRDVLFWWIVKSDGEIYQADDSQIWGKKIDDSSLGTKEIVVKNSFYKGEKIKLIVYPIEIQEDRKELALYLGISLESILAAQNTMIVSFLKFFAIIIAVVVLISFFLAKNFTAPIRKLTRVVQKIDKGDLSQRARVVSEDEIGILANSFNQMTDRLVEAWRFPESIVRSMADSLIVVTPEAKIREVNQATLDLLGYQRKELLGQPIEKIFGHRAADAMFRGAGLKKLIKEDTIKDKRVTFQTKKSQGIPVAVSRSVVRDGKLDYIVVIGKDMREILELEEEKRKTEVAAAKRELKSLREFDRLKDDFLNIAAHELKTPLTSIVGLSEIIKEQKPPFDGQYQKYIDIIHEEGNRLSHIVKKILTVTRYESGKETIYNESFNLASFVLSLLPSLNLAAEETKSKVFVNIKTKNIAIKSDKEKISQVIYNFVDNAVKYGPQGQTITISIIKPKNKQVKVAVTDQGKGIPSGLKKGLFAKFGQLEPSLSRTQEGVGLGLYICKLIIDKLGGKIGVKSELGKGSTFYFVLPV